MKLRDRSWGVENVTFIFKSYVTEEMVIHANIINVKMCVSSRFNC